MKTELLQSSASPAPDGARGLGGVGETRHCVSRYEK